MILQPNEIWKWKLFVQGEGANGVGWSGIRSTGDEHCKKQLDDKHSWHQLNLDGRYVINILFENTTLEIVLNFSKIPQLAYFTEK